jgi:signal transduction histidine kinase
VADRGRLQGRLAQVVAAYHQLAASEDARHRSAKLAALAEFAAGAGHELNNPLAVIVGRAQLLLVKAADPDVARSLRTILNQAQRAHRILRDLMYVARPPQPRQRFCLPDEIVRASVRDAREEAEGRGVRLQVETPECGRRVWADPDGLRHLADALLRNALEATPKGGLVRFLARGDATELRWSVEDSGRGLSQKESEHLFDPFFCGRQAGRGLGMGLPRAARFVGQLGGEIRHHSVPGQGSAFSARLPLAEPPKPPASDQEGPVVAAPGGATRATAA